VVPHHPARPLQEATMQVPSNLWQIIGLIVVVILVIVLFNQIVLPLLDRL
jgi:hypothetical protein